ncbi:unnamed protein product [Cuscuta epithymum]|uniref:Uncharacterized protein n=1 Tax=Cuscuta epithymum TaxID=186058 RepID=A0AAV0CE63_9ASTE|nr:unnamed protein product [Cuscuta epithymum]
MPQISNRSASCFKDSKKRIPGLIFHKLSSVAIAPIPRPSWAGSDRLNLGNKIDKVDAATARAETAQRTDPPGLPLYPTGSQGKYTAQIQNPPGSSQNPPGFQRQTAPAPSTASAGGTPRAPNVVPPSKTVDKVSEAGLEDADRVVMHEKDLKLNDVVIKCAVINGKALKLDVKPFKFVHASVIRVDTSLRLTDDLDRKGLTFTAKCLEGMPGVTKKKGEVCFDSKFTSPFRAFFGL